MKKKSMRAALGFMCLAASTFQVGCAAQKSEMAVVSFREKLITLQTDQILDNLIRAKVGLPIMHLVFKDLQVQHKDTATLTGKIGETAADTRVSTFGAAGALALTRAVGSAFEIGGSGSTEALTNFIVNPVREPELYVYFREVGRDDGKFAVSAAEPPPSAVHAGMSREWAGRWYYVVNSTEAIKSFTQLCDLAAASTTQPSSGKEGEGVRMNRLQEAFESIDASLQRIRANQGIN